MAITVTLKTRHVVRVNPNAALKGEIVLSTEFVESPEAFNILKIVIVASVHDSDDASVLHDLFEERGFTFRSEGF